MVEGINSFREKFTGYEDCYTVIGGAACDILMSEADIPFRMTKDIDVILILEDRRVDFVKTFWEYKKKVVTSVDGRTTKICIFTVSQSQNLDIRL